MRSCTPFVLVVVDPGAVLHAFATATIHSYYTYIYIYIVPIYNRSFVRRLSELYGEGDAAFVRRVIDVCFLNEGIDLHGRIT